ncbi:MAG: ECF-type sigma factor [Planctomycetaceae bacterium]|nr:ECF-type sigma factor [Planctomycetaceae bacterium]
MKRLCFLVMSEVTAILERVAQGDPHAADELLPLVYDELRKLAAAKLAHERPGQTLQATALVHEAYLRLVGPTGPVGPESPMDVDSSNWSRPAVGTYWHSRGHFFAAAAEAMRRILVDGARRKRAIKAGGAMQRVDLEGAALTIDPEPDLLLAVDEALVKLAGDDPQAADLANLRLFAGLSVDEAALALGISRTTGFRHWTYARAFLQAELQK